MRKLISVLACFAVITSTASVYAESDFRDIRAEQGENGKYAFFENGEQLTEYVYDKILEDFTSSYHDEILTETPHGQPTTYFVKIYSAQNNAEVVRNGITYRIGYDFSEFNGRSRRISYSDHEPSGKFHIYNDRMIGLPVTCIMPICTAIYNTETEKFIFCRGDYNGTEVISVKGDYIIMRNDNNNKYGVIDADGRLVLDFIHSRLTFDENSDGSMVADADKNVINLKTVQFEPMPVYNTSEKVTINGFEIPCYEVDGKVMVKAEDLGGYGFDVFWDGAEVKLYITRNPDYYLINPAETPQENEAGTVYTYTANSNIKVYVNDKWIKSYSIDGKMLIDLHDINIDGWNSDTQNINSFTLKDAETKMQQDTATDK